MIDSSDTPPEVEAQLTALYQARSPAERVRMATAMYMTAKRLALSGLRHEDAHRGEIAVRRALLDRLYGEELTLAVRDAVAEGMAR